MERAQLSTGRPKAAESREISAWTSQKSGPVSVILRFRIPQTGAPGAARDAAFTALRDSASVKLASYDGTRAALPAGGRANGSIRLYLSKAVAFTDSH